MKYKTTFYLLFKLSLNNPPDGFMDLPYKRVLNDVTDLASVASAIQQVMMLSAMVELDELDRDGYFDNEQISVQELLDELKENEPEEFNKALASYQESWGDK